MLKKIPVKEMGFEELIRGGYYYVDKTMVLKKYMESHAYVEQLLMRECSGKSLLLSMMQCFLEVGSDSSLFDGLAITKDKAFCERYMGQYPVVSLCWKDVHGESFGEAMEVMRDVIRQEAQRFSFLLESEKLLDDDKVLYQKIVDGRMSESLLEQSLYLLTQLLHKHYGKCVVVLVDDCDVPSYYACKNGYENEMAHFIGSMCNWVCKTNGHLSFALFVGSVRFFRESSITSGFNNLVCREAGGMCDFNEEEVDTLLAYYGLSGFKNTFTEWYGGYSGNMYDPYGMMHYCEALGKYINSSPAISRRETIGDKVVMRLLERSTETQRYEIEELLQGRGLDTEVNKEVTYTDAFSHTEDMFSALCNLGYFVKRDGRLFVVNRMMRTALVWLVESWYFSFISDDTERINQFYEAIEKEDASEAEDILNDYFYDAIITAETEEEQGKFVLGLLRELLYRKSWLYQRCELPICIVIRSWNDVVIVMAGSYGNIEEACTEVKQTMQKFMDYHKELCVNMKKMVGFGIGFTHKRCEVKLVE